MKWAAAPRNVMLVPSDTGLPRESVANVSQILTLDRKILNDRAGRLPPEKLDLILRGIYVVLGR
jgi:mRNA interferase MazF